MTDYQLSQTEDGSPTLLTTYKSGVSEKMHHFRGAQTESLYIYEPAVRWAFEQQQGPIHVMSLGLGLGYNELIATGCAIKHNRWHELTLTTYELDSLLVAEFRAWVEGNSSRWSPAYDQIEASLAQHFGMKGLELKKSLAQLLLQERWRIKGGFPSELPFADRYHSILYDAFSGKMDQDLWSQEFLSQFLATHASPTCAFATYAATGNLKRALKQTCFTLIPKPGFGGKKESTFATRHENSTSAVLSV